MKQVEVVLPYCEECGRVGKIPGDHWRGKGWCYGPKDGMHPRKPLKALWFVSLGDPFPMRHAK